MSLRSISIPPRKTNLYLTSQSSQLYRPHRKLSLLAHLVDGETIIKGCGRPFHQFIDRKYKKAIQDIIRSTERFLSRSESYSNKCINLRMLKFLIRLYKKRLSYSVMNTARNMLCYPWYYQHVMGQSLANTQLPQVCSKEFSGTAQRYQDISGS